MQRIRSKVFLILGAFIIVGFGAIAKKLCRAFDTYYYYDNNGYCVTILATLALCSPGGEGCTFELNGENKQVYQSRLNANICFTGLKKEF